MINTDPGQMPQGAEFEKMSKAADVRAENFFREFLYPHTGSSLIAQCATDLNEQSLPHALAAAAQWSGCRLTQTCVSVLRPVPGTNDADIREAMKADAEGREVINKASRMALLKYATQETRRGLEGLPGGGVSHRPTACKLVAATGQGQIGRGKHRFIRHVWSSGRCSDAART